MSLILDALNRSERERRGGDEVPNLATEHYSGAADTSSSWRQQLLWAALVAALLVIGWLVWERFGAQPGTAELTTAEQSADMPAAPTVTSDRQGAAETAVTEARAVAVAAQTATPVADTTPDAVAELPEPVVAEPAVSADVIDLYKQGGSGADAAPAPAPAESAPVEVAPPADPDPVVETATVVAPPVSEESLDIEALVARAENELENARLAEHPAPFLADLSQQKKNQIPTLMYSRHDYASDAKASAVTINGKSLRAGGTAGGGVRVVEVLPDSVVLSHQGTEFRLRALNSWVNL